MYAIKMQAEINICKYENKYRIIRICTIAGICTENIPIFH